MIVPSPKFQRRLVIAAPLGVVVVAESKNTGGAAKLGLGGDTVNPATGAAGGAGGVTATTLTLTVLVPVRPLLSVTLSPAVYEPIAAYA